MITFTRALLSVGILLSIIVLRSNVFANSSSYYDKDAATVYPIENINIAMQKEIVRIKPGEKEPQWEARCEYTFYNKSNVEEKVTMGYPDWTNSLFNPDRLPSENPLDFIPADPKESNAFWSYFETLPVEAQKRYREGIFVVGYGYDEVYLGGYKQNKIPYIGRAWNLHDLKVKVGSKNLQTTHKAIVDPKSLPGQGAYIWKITFAPNQTIKVNVSFSFKGFTDLGGYSYQKAIYILRTGSLWAEKIGIADIFWDINGRNINKKQIIPQTFKIKNKVIHWHFEDFEPTEDIVISSGSDPNPTPQSIVSNITAIFQTKRYEANKRYYTAYDVNEEAIDPNVHRLYLKALRNEIYARHGYVFKTSKMKTIFENAPWYRARKNFKVSELNEVEKKNITFISSYEKNVGSRGSLL